MVPTYHPSDGPHGTLLIRVGWRDVGLINEPELGWPIPGLQARWGTSPGRAPHQNFAALACCADSDRRSLWSCDSDAAIGALDADIGGS
jgi:hypothetical protein